MKPSETHSEKNTATKTYRTHLDDKQRIVIRNPHDSYYEVHEFSDGHIEMFPYATISSKEDEFVISERTLQMLDGAVRNLSNGIVSAPVDTSELIGLLDDDDRKELEEIRRSADAKE